MLQKEKETLDALLGGDVPVDLECVIDESKNPSFLQQIAIAYNWDDGFEIPKRITENECCDSGIDLTLFWLAEAMSYLTGEIEESEYNQDWVAFSQLMIQRIENAREEKSHTSFDPNLTRVQIYQLKKDGISESFLNPIEGSEPIVTI
ncbi:DUF4274 domain-containing protein [Coraliomargarita sp. SDUM461003]|uniref:DUF4274 domain-containing protein n=1 Tax=Thalassobacterium maritimum TaxID=3041265 RepID=A0ABU1AZN2_9BACT|nr:DUF4274 domain-containing protein [Coraliomargarita sp. SDUM461003]MDQ8209609.1 DUF4274 domain-containing protein [Coraliomargarita sp. SDUM461003]